MFCPRECHVEDLESASETSRLLERVAHYQMEYDELCEFTRNEKKIYEEFFSIQVHWTSPLDVHVLTTKQLDHCLV
jgi:hypothetical protein